MEKPMTLRHAVAKGSTGTKNRLVFMAFPRSWPRVTVIHAHSSPIQKTAPDFDAPRLLFVLPVPINAPVELAFVTQLPRGGGQ